jgi:hypothetical protein
VAVLALLAGRPAVAGAAVATAAVRLARGLRRARVPAGAAPRTALRAGYQTWLGIGRYCAQFAGPAVLAGALSGSPGRRAGRLAAAAAVLLGPPLVESARHLGRIDPVRFTLGRLADDAAYGAGVIAGCAAHRTAAPLLPRFTR